MKAQRPQARWVPLSVPCIPSPLEAIEPPGRTAAHGSARKNVGGLAEDVGGGRGAGGPGWPGRRARGGVLYGERARLVHGCTAARLGRLTWPACGLGRHRQVCVGDHAPSAPVNPKSRSDKSGDYAGPRRPASLHNSPSSSRYQLSSMHAMQTMLLSLNHRPRLPRTAERLRLGSSGSSVPPRPLTLAQSSGALERQSSTSVF